MELAEGAEDLGGAAHQLEGRGDARGDADAEMHAHLAGKHDRQPRHEERNRDDGEGRERGDLPALGDTAKKAGPDEEAAEKGAHPHEGGGKDLEGREGVALVAAGAFDRDRGLGVLTAKLFELGMGEGGDHPGHERDARRAAVEEDEDRPEIPR